MTIPAVDLLEVTPPRPLAVCTVSNRYVVAVDGVTRQTNNPSAPNPHTYSIYDTVTGDESLSDGIGYHVREVFESEGYAWCVSTANLNGNNLSVHRINPVNKGLLTWTYTGSWSTGTGFSRLGCVVTDDYIWIGSNQTTGTRSVLFDRSTHGFVSNPATGSPYRWVKAQGYVWTANANSTTWLAFDENSLSAVPSENWVSPVAAPVETASGQLAVRDDRYVCGVQSNVNTVVVWDFLAKTGVHITPEAGAVTQNSSVSLGDDGLFYIAASNSAVPQTAVTAIDPITLTARTEHITARTWRSTAVSVAGQMHAPAGDPW